MKRNILSILSASIMALAMSACSIFNVTTTSSSSNEESTSITTNTGSTTTTQSTENTSATSSGEIIDEYDYDSLPEICLVDRLNYLEEEGGYDNFAKFKRLNIYFENTLTHEVSNSISYSYDGTLLGDYEFRAVVNLENVWYKVSISLNQNENMDFDVIFDGDNQSFNINSSYGFLKGYKGQYNFTASLKNELFIMFDVEKTSFDFEINLDWDNFTIVVDNVEYGNTPTASYSGLIAKSELLSIKYYAARVNEGEELTYCEFQYTYGWSAGEYKAYAVANTKKGEVTSKTISFFVNYLSFGDNLSLSSQSLDVYYESTSLSDYELYEIQLLNNGKNTGATASWLNPDTTLDMTKSSNYQLSLTADIVFSKDNYVDYHAEIQLNINLSEIRIPSTNIGPNPKYYTGEEVEVDLDYYDDNIFEVVEEESTFKATNAGSYQIVIRIKDNVSATFYDGETEVAIGWNINKANSYSFYALNDNNATYRLELEDLEGNIYPCSYDGTTFTIHGIDSRHYLRLYRVFADESEALMQIDGVSVVNQGNLTDVGYTQGKGVYIESTDYFYDFELALKLGALENSNFNYREIPFKAYVTYPYHNQVVLDENRLGLYGEKVNVYHSSYNDSSYNQFEDTANFCSIGSSGFTIMSIGVLFESIDSISFVFNQPEYDNCEATWSIAIYIGNDRSHIENPYSAGALNPYDTRISTTKISDSGESSIDLTDKAAINAKDGPLYVRVKIQGHGGAGSNSYLSIKSIIIHNTGTFEPITF